jgi:hypothetical protein
MNKKKTKAMVFLDLCAFACYTDDCVDARRAFEKAYLLAEAYSLPGLEAYRDFVISLDSSRYADERCKDN